MGLCIARNNKIVLCAGKFIEEAGLCDKHMVLFEVWIDEFEGHRVYRTDYPRNWKRSIFHKWLNGIGNKKAQAIYDAACKVPT